MKTKNLAVLGIVTLTAIGGAALVVRGRSGARAAPGSTARLLPELSERVNDVREVEVRKGADLVTIRREGGAWGVAERGGYPVEVERVKETILALAELEIEERKTTRPENYAKLGVQDPAPAPAAPVEDAADAADAEDEAHDHAAEAGEEAPELPTTVVLKDANGQTMAALIVGEPLYRGRSPGVYVREVGQPQAYLCAGRVEVEATPSSWIEREILRVDSKDLTRVHVRRADGEELVVEKHDPTSTQFEVRGVPDGRELRYQGAANGVATVLSSLSLDDVMPLDEVDFSAEPLATTEFHRADGEVLVIETAKVGDKTWARIHSRYEPPPPPPETLGPDAPPEAPAQGDPAAAEPAEVLPDAAGADAGGEPGADAGATPDPEALRKEVEARIAESNARVTLWAYALPTYKVDNLTKRMEDLLAPLAEEPALDPTLELPSDGTLPETSDPFPPPDDGGDGGSTQDGGGAGDPPPGGDGR